MRRGSSVNSIQHCALREKADLMRELELAAPRRQELRQVEHLPLRVEAPQRRGVRAPARDAHLDAVRLFKYRMRPG